jgi:antitoxin component YwqK of YwqJK toxin-antitoxin module
MGLFDWLLKPKHGDLINENGINETYRKKQKNKIVKERFNTKDGLRHGEYKSFYLDGTTINIIANYKDGKLDGECKKWSISSGPFGGDCWRYIEIYENGELRNKKVYFTGASNPLDPIKKIRTLANEAEFKEGNSEKGLIAENIESTSEL